MPILVFEYSNTSDSISGQKFQVRETKGEGEGEQSQHRRQGTDQEKEEEEIINFLLIINEQLLSNAATIVREQAAWVLPDYREVVPAFRNTQCWAPPNHRGQPAPELPDPTRILHNVGSRDDIWSFAKPCSESAWSSPG